MFKIQSRGAARLAAASLASGLLMAGAIAGAGAASADDTTPTAGGATAVLAGLQEDKSDDAVIVKKNGEKEFVSAGLFSMNVDGGGNIQTYCIDIEHPTSTGVKYEEAPWSASSLHDESTANKINWILQHSYPKATPDALSLASGVEGLNPKLAAAGTQVAIWRFSDKAAVTAKNDKAEKLADYLWDKADKAAAADEPGASLTLAPVAVAGKSGEKLGPVTVHTSADTATVGLAPTAPAGVKITDKAGKPVTSAKEGTQLYFDIPAGAADGTTSLTVQAATTIPIGRVFTAIGTNKGAQTQILAGSSESSVTATATANWAAKGPIPAVSATVDCAKNGVDVTAANEGDQPFTFELAGKSHTIEAGKSETISVPVQEDQPYKITISGPNGFSKTFKGVLDCKTASTTGGTGGPTTQPTPAPSTGTTGGGDLAETGSSSATPIIAGVAIALVVAGGGAVFFLRKKKAATAGE